MLQDAWYSSCSAVPRRLGRWARSAGAARMRQKLHGGL